MNNNRNLNIYWASRLIAGVSGTAAPVVLTVATLTTTIGSSVLASMLSAQAMGQLVALAISGVIIDRVNRKIFLITVQALTGATWVAFASLLFMNSGQVISWIAVGAVLGLLSGLNGPATQSLLSFLVDREAMKATVANIRISLNVVALLSPVIAGASIALVQPTLVPLIMAFLMLGSAVTLSALPTMRSDTSPGEIKGRLKDALQGWFLIVILVTSVMNLFWAGFFQLRGPIVIASASDSGPAQWGIVSASFAAGLVVGGFYFRQKTFKNPIGTPLLLLAPKAIPILVIALFPNFVVLSLTTFIAGFFLEAFAVNFYTQVQLRVPQHALGKALALDAFIGVGLLPFGYMMAEASARSGTTELGGILASGGTVALAILGWVLLRSTRSNENNLPDQGLKTSSDTKERTRTE